MFSNPAEQKAVYNKLKAGSTVLLFITPERCTTNSFRSCLFDLVSNGRLAYVIIDEAHCITQWGETFRSSYLRLGEIREITQNSHVPWIALTATATPEVKNKIKKSLKMESCEVIEEDPARKNI